MLALRSKERDQKENLIILESNKEDGKNISLR